MSPSLPSNDDLIAAIPADGIAFPALARALHLTQRKLHPLVKRLVERGVLTSETRDGVRWVSRDGHTIESLARALAACHRELAARDAALARIHRIASRALGGTR